MKYLREKRKKLLGENNTFRGESELWIITCEWCGWLGMDILRKKDFFFFLFVEDLGLDLQNIYDK